MVLNPIFCYVSPKIVIFHEPLIVGTHNKCHWIQHASDPKYMYHSSNFDAFCPVRNQQNVKLLPEIVIFHEPLIAETQNLQHWIWHALNPKYAPLKPFWCMFPSRNQQNVKFWLFPELPWQNNWKNVNLHREKVFAKACKSAHIGFWVCWDKYFLSDYGFFAFLMGRSRYRVLKHSIGVQWDPRRTAAYIPSHVHGPIFHVLLWFWTPFSACYVSPKINKMWNCCLKFFMNHLS